MPRLGTLASHGLPVASGFSLSPRAISLLRGSDRSLRQRTRAGLEKALELVESATGLALCDRRCTLSLRVVLDAPSGGGAPVSRVLRCPGGTRAAALRGLIAEIVALSALPHGSGRGVTAHALPAPLRGQEPLWVVCYTHDPLTGSPALRGRYALVEDPERIRSGAVACGTLEELSRESPALVRELRRISRIVRSRFLGPLELELVRDRTRLLLTGVRRAGAGPAAAARIAVSLVAAGRSTPERAVREFSVEHLEALLRPMPRARDLAALPLFCRGLAASPGIAAGPAVFSPEQALALAQAGRRAVLVAERILPEQVSCVGPAGGIVTSMQGLCTRFAEAARAAGIPVVAGVAPLTVHGGTAEAGAEACAQGAWLTVDGGRGEVWVGEARLRDRRMPRCAGAILGWADEVRAAHGLSLRVNADSAAETALGCRLGAQGVGLCRTERMLGSSAYLGLLQGYVVAVAPARRSRIEMRLRGAFRRQFRSLLEVARGRPVTVRLLDPSLGELLPEDPEGAGRLAGETGVAAPLLLELARGMRGTNPVLGFRGCRVGLLRPDIYDVQLRSLFEAACALSRRGVPVSPEILFPLVSAEGEIAALRARAESVIEDTCAAEGVSVPYRIGAMIEVPRGALVADRIAAHAEFLCFGTNDLTQTTFGLSREDAGAFLSDYLDRGLWQGDPFRVLDREGVGELLRVAIQRARRTNPSLSLGICGEHAGDPASIRGMLGGSLPRLSIDYLSCSPFRLPAARLAVAQALLERPAVSTKASRRSTGRRYRGSSPG